MARKRKKGGKGKYSHLSAGQLRGLRKAWAKNRKKKGKRRSGKGKYSHLSAAQLRGLRKAWKKNRKGGGGGKKGRKGRKGKGRWKKYKRIQHLPRCIVCRKPVPAHVMDKHYAKRHSGAASSTGARKSRLGRWAAAQMAKVDWSAIGRDMEAKRVAENMRAANRSGGTLADKIARDEANARAAAAAREAADASRFS